ncbi:hypothetical protein V8F20_012603 [Naviculisporaceae sp. PSN 640]
MDLFRPSSSQSGSSLRPTRRRDRFVAIFSRSRSPSRTPSHAEHSNAAAFAANQAIQVSESSSLGSQDSKLRAGAITQSPNEKNSNSEQPLTKDTDDAPAAPQVIVTEVPDLHDENLDLPTSAYEKALSSLDDSQRQKIKNEETIRDLFEQLNRADKGHSERSLLRRGLSAVKPYLERMNATIDFISPFASMEPAVGSALGLVKGAASIAIAVCGRFDDMTKDIAGFLERIPAIDRCSDVARDGRLPEIHQALVDMYKDLLLFYLKTVVLFEKAQFALHVALDALKPTIAEIVSSFKTHADLLSKLLEAESFASIQEIKDEQVEALIRETLDRNRENQWSYHNELRRRADAACDWITSDDSFSYWMLNARDSNLLALFGDMGCGKTTMAAFVADTLAQGDRPLCAYYCKDEHEAAKLGNIYRSILLQFLRRKPILKQRFWNWHKRTSPLMSIDPTQSDEKLREFLFEIISSSKEAVFIVLDALDECKPYPRKQLFSLFGDLFQNHARLKVFVSLRYDEEIEAELPIGVTKIELRPERKRDRAIAAYLVAEMNLPTEFQPRVVEELAAKSHGSAIWLRIAVEYMAGFHIKNERGLEMTLERLPSSRGLTELYGKLFDRICEDDLDRATLLQRALETLAVACRPLSQEELAYAVFVINPVGEDATTLADLDELANSVDLLSMVRPFVSVFSSQTGRSPRLRLVHLSLKDLLLTSPPSEWCFAKAVAKRKKGGRAEELEAGLLHSCIKYLLFDECGENRLSLEWTDDTDQAGGLLSMGDVFDDEAEDTIPKTPTSATTTVSRRTSDIFDPAELGFGHFFAYAGAFWTHHFSSVSRARRADPRQLTVLCQKGSQRMENWVQQWRRPNCSHISELEFPEYMSNLDPLVITALFGPADSVTDLLSLDFDESVLTEDSVWTTIKHLIRRGHITAIRNLVHDKRFQKTLCSCKFLYQVLPVWILRPVTGTDWGSSQTPRDPEWEGIFEFVISQLREDLLEVGNDLLRRAASCGCLVFIRKLFEAAQTDPELHRAIVTPEVKQKIGKGRESLGSHQSIGQAAYEGRTDIVRFLCDTPGLGLESHLYYVNEHGHTVFHQAARSRQADVFRILLRHWPEGVHIRDKVCDTPLNLVVFTTGSSMTEDRDIMLVRLLIHEGKADATGRFENPGFSPLCMVARGGCIKLLRVLVVEGSADIWQVVNVDQKTGRPFLIPGMDTLEDAGKRDQVLKELCSLLPLAVSMEYLI